MNAVACKDLPLSERLSHCPKILSRFVKRVKDGCDPKRVWIFGSRARGDERPLSDVDLAVELDVNNQPNWEKFVAQYKELPDTLLPLDLVNFLQAPQKLQEKILEEGILLYDKNMEK